MSTIDPGDGELDLQQLLEYQKAGPRYTSYPTIPVWRDGFGEDELTPHLRHASEARAGQPLSVYVHLPFCPHRCLYCGCASWESSDPTRLDRYLDRLGQEIDRWAALLPTRRHLAALHLGGGTPNALSLAQLERLHTLLTRWLTPLPGAQLALEANPATLTDEQVRLLGRLGFNRLSLGVQDFTPAVQEAVQRPGSFARTHELMALARASGFGGVNLDVIYGLPRQTRETFGQSLAQVVELAPDRVAVFGYAHVPWIHPLQRSLEVYGIPDVLERVELYRVAYRTLTAGGYRPIGMDHFARPEDELSRAQDEGRLDRNFQGYTVNPAPDLIGLGVTAISHVGGAHAQNEKELDRYEATVSQGRLATFRGLSLSPDDELRGYVIKELMCNLRLSFADVAARFGVQPRTELATSLDQLAPFLDAGHVLLDAQGIRIPARSRLLIRNIVMVFDAYLGRETATAGPRFSKTI